MRRLLVISIIATIAAISIANPAFAAGNIMPSFATVPTGWVTDRYDPAAFANVGTFQGHTNVLGISIDGSTGFGARPSPYQSSFYNTQGKKFTFSPTQGAGSILSADLYIPASWANAANGNVRTDMWGTMVDTDGLISNYAIIGFTNYGGAPRLRVWDDDTANGWVDLTTPISYGTWHNFSIQLNGDSSIGYYVNGALVYTDVDTALSTAFKEVIMQAYNFEDPAILGAVLAPYTAHWSNSVAVPTNAGQCKGNGWQLMARPNGTGFKNQGDCIQYVNTGK